MSGLQSDAAGSQRYDVAPVCPTSVDGSGWTGESLSRRMRREALLDLVDHTRPDREPSSCRFDQLDVPLNCDLYDVLEKK